MKNKKLKEILITTIIHIELLILAIIVLIPVIWIIGSSLGNTTSLASSKMIPDNVTLNNYKSLISETNYILWYKNTFFVAIVTMIFSVIISTFTAYIFSRFSFKGKKNGLLTMLVLQMFPSFLGMTAIYILFLTFGLLDNLWGLIIVYVAGQIPFNTWLMKGYLGNIPKSLDEAAMLDGASKFRIFFTIIIPLSIPIITFVAVSTFMGPWMDYIFPRLILSSDTKKTLAVGLFDFINGNTNNNYTMFASGAVLVALPITILYMSLQKYLIAGATAGATKE
jgi:arabinogalactan oligomer / maltooligosaccharide transport system permease protein